MIPDQTDTRRETLLTALVETQREIAQHLGRIAATLEAAHPEVLLPEECRQRRCDYWTGYLAYGGPDMSHEAYHSQEAAYAQHSSRCTLNERTGKCGVCERYERRLRA